MRDDEVRDGELTTAGADRVVDEAGGAKAVEPSDPLTNEHADDTDATPARPLRAFGSARGLIHMRDDFDDPLADFAGYS